MTDKQRIIIALVCALVLMLSQGYIFEWLWEVWVDFWGFAFVNLIGIDIVLIVLGAIVLGIYSNVKGSYFDNSMAWKNATVTALIFYSLLDSSPKTYASAILPPWILNTAHMRPIQTDGSHTRRFLV